MKRGWTGLASLLMLLMPLAAHADIWIPSFVQCITSPLLSSFSVIALIVTIPVTLGVSALEALVVRKYAKGIQLSSIIWYLAIINIITSIFGTIMMPLGTELWPGLLVCFVLTVIAEGILLFAFADRLKLPRSIRQAFAISTKMNAVSYAVLAGTLAALVYLPRIGNESPIVRKAISGKLAMVSFGDSFQVLDLSSTPSGLSKEQTLGLTPNEYLAGTGGQIVGLMPHEIVKLRYTDRGWKKHFVNLPPELSDPISLSQDGRLICCTFNDGQSIYDLKSRRMVRYLGRCMKKVSIAAFSFDNRFVAIADMSDTTSNTVAKLIDLKTGAVAPLKDAWGFTFNPTRNQLAWETDNCIIIYDCFSGLQKTLKVPGTIASRIAWSPEGRFIAYLGHPNWFTAQNWRSDARAVDVKTGDSATLHRNIWTSGAPYTLFWLN